MQMSNGFATHPYTRFPKEIENYYIHDMPLLKRNTLYTMYRTYMAEYQLKKDISKTKAQIMYCYGSKEMKCVKVVGTTL